MNTMNRTKNYYLYLSILERTCLGLGVLAGRVRIDSRFAALSNARQSTDRPTQNILRSLC